MFILTRGRRERKNQEEQERERERETLRERERETLRERERIREEQERERETPRKRETQRKERERRELEVVNHNFPIQVTLRECYFFHIIFHFSRVLNWGIIQK